jgi:isoleucyl-tRNA synthetase
MAAHGAAAAAAAAAAVPLLTPLDRYALHLLWQAAHDVDGHYEDFAFGKGHQRLMSCISADLSQVGLLNHISPPRTSASE